MGHKAGENELDGCINSLGDSQHDIGTEDKEDVIKEEKGQKDESVLEVPNEQALHGLEREDQREQGCSQGSRGKTEAMGARKLLNIIFL